MTRQISDRQAAIILVVSIVSLKFLILPALLSKYAVNDGYITAIIGLLIDFMFILVIMWVIKKAPHLTYGEILERAFGVIVRRIINFIMFVYFFIKGILIIKETHNYFNETLFEHINWNFFVLPLFLIIFFIMIKDLKTIARSVEFFAILIFAGIFLTVLIPIKNADLTNLLPVLENGVGGVFEALLRCNFSFGDYFILMLLMGRIDVKKNSVNRIMKYIIFTNIGVVIFYVVFIAIFGNIGINQSLAISDMPLHSNLASSMGRLDWVVIILWVITLVFQAGILLSMACHCFSETFPCKNKYVPSFVLIALMFLAVTLLYMDLANAIKIVTSIPFSITSVVVQVVIPLLILIGTIILIKHKKVGALKAVKKGQIKLQYTNIFPTANISTSFSLCPVKIKKRKEVKAHA